MKKAETTESIARAIRPALEAFSAGLHAALPGKVETYDPDTRVASVKPTVKRPYVDESRALAVIPEVYVVHPTAGESGVELPVKKGTKVLLVFSDYPLDRWSESDGSKDTAPDDTATHDLTHAIAIPGLLPPDAAPAAEEPEALVAFNGDTRLELHTDRVVSKGDWEHNGDLDVDGAINATGAINAGGTIESQEDVIGGGVSLKHHTHFETGAVTEEPQ